jgi:hypothetical protein
MPKLTKRIIDAVEPQATEFFLWDEGIPGFGLRVMPSGRKSFVVQFCAGRRARRMSLGPSTVLTCDQARTRAITIIAAVKNGDEAATRTAAVERLRLHKLPKLHSKIIAIDTDLLCIGSYNWLSADRHGQYARHETSFVYRGKHLEEEISTIVGSLRGREK